MGSAGRAIRAKALSRYSFSWCWQAAVIFAREVEGEQRNYAHLVWYFYWPSWLRPLFRKDWIVYSKPPFGGPEYVLQYLGRYTHRVAISNHRLVALAHGQVTFRWRDSANPNQQKVMTVSRDEFLRPTLLHLLPKGFVRIRNF